MARFIFSMQNILNMKEKLEEQAKNNFAQANRSLQEALLMQKQCENRLEAGKQTLKEAMLENLKVGQIRRREDDVEIFRMYLRQQILVVKQKEKEVEVAREHLNEAMKERKTFEKLKEKAFEKFVAEENQKAKFTYDGMLAVQRQLPLWCREIRVKGDLSWQKRTRIRKIRFRQMKVQEVKLLQCLLYLSLL